MEANRHAASNLLFEQLLDQSGITFDIKTIIYQGFLYPSADYYLVRNKLQLMTMVVLSTVSHTATIVINSRGFRRCSNFIELLSITDHNGIFVIE